jgi:hypothetical protein
MSYYNDVIISILKFRQKYDQQLKLIISCVFDFEIASHFQFHLFPNNTFKAKQIFVTDAYQESQHRCDKCNEKIDNKKRTMLR